MSNVLAGLKPESVFRNFEELTRIPRESGNEKAVSDYLVEFAKKNNLEVIQEECLNVIIKKPATAGYENAPTVILQGHMDMVCIKRDDIEFDFTKDPIPLVVDGDYIRTKGTTLGADNGIAVAMAMAILESNDIPHPPLVALVTVAEETGMDGVVALNPENISGDILINIDSEEEGVILASCAGGVNNIVHLPVEWTKAEAQKETYQIGIKDLLGGHSGIEINKNRASAIKLLGRLLEVINRNMKFDVAKVSGGEKMNAIPKTADAIIMIEGQDQEKLENIVKECQQTFASEFEVADPNVKVTMKKVDAVENIFSDNTKNSLISSLRLMPFGVQTMSAAMSGLVESSNNIGILATEKDEIIINNALRSSVKSLKAEMNSRIETISNLVGARFELVADYPEWQFKVDSPIRELMKEVYKDMYGKEIKVDAIHAGLECGFLKEKVGDIDMISMGPNMHDVHTPNEHLSISSTKNVFEFLCETLKRLKK